MHTPGAPYDLYVFDISYFSGKMEAYLRYKGIPFVRHEPSWGDLLRDLYPNTGWMKVPAMRTPEGVWLHDSTPMILFFEEQAALPRVLPADPYQAFFSRLLEDYADEWMWRPALYYRWYFDVDAALNVSRFLREFLYDAPTPNWATKRLTRLRQHVIYGYGDGIRGHNKAHVESVYLRTLDHLQAIFEVTPYLLGESPTLADFGFYASMFRHFSLDPTPARIMRARAPAVYEWVARLWNADAQVLTDRGQPRLLPPGTLPPGWSALLRDCGRMYLPYLDANAAAFAAERARFTLKLPHEGVTYPRLPTSQYRVFCREQLRGAYDALPPDARAAVTETLREHGCMSPTFSSAPVPSHYRDAQAPPFFEPFEPTRWDRFTRRLLGTHFTSAGGSSPSSARS